MSPGKFAARARFEVFFKGGGFGSVPECNSRRKTPRLVFARVSDFSGIVSSKTRLKIVGETDIVAVGIQFAHENLDVVEHGSADSVFWPGLPSRSLAAGGGHLRTRKTASPLEGLHPPGLEPGTN